MILETVFHIYNYYEDGVYRKNAAELWEFIVKIASISEDIKPNIKEIKGETDVITIISFERTTDLHTLRIFEDSRANLEIMVESFYYEDTPHIPVLHNKIFSELKAAYPRLVVVASNDFTGIWHTEEPYDTN